MRFALVSILLSLGGSVSARCGTVSNSNIEALHAVYQAYEALPIIQSTRRRETKYSINTYLYVITQDSTIAGGHVERETINEQVRDSHVDALASGSRLMLN